MKEKNELVVTRVTVIVQYNGHIETYILGKGVVHIDTPSGSLNKIGSCIEVKGIIRDNYGENNPKE